MSRITFEEVIKDCGNKENFIIAPGCSTENKGFFTILRVDRNTLPKGYYAYDIRHGTRGGLCTVEPNVAIDHAGTFITKNPIKLNKENYYSLCGRGGYSLC